MRRSFLVFIIVAPLVACKEGPPASSTPATPLEVKPLGSSSAPPPAPIETVTEDVPPDAEAKPPEPFTNVPRLRQCCHQLSIEAARLGATPEASLFATAVARCKSMANAAAPNTNAPELGVIRHQLAGRTIPAVCAGF